MTEKRQNCHIIWVTCWGDSSEFCCLVFRNERFYSYKYTKTTGLTSSHKSPVEPTTFLLWGDRTNHCFLKLLRFGYSKGRSQIIQEDQRLYTQLSSVCCCTHAALASYNTLSRLRRLPLLRTQEKTGRNDAGSEKRGQEGLSTLVFSPDIICTWAHPLWLMSRITSAVCSQEVSHLLSLRCEQHYLAHALLTVPQLDTGGAVVSSRYVRIRSSKKIKAVITAG